MKKILSVAIPVCIISYILFGLSVMILGKSYSSSGSTYIDQVNSGTYYDGYRVIFEREVTGYGDGNKNSWKINNDFPNIHINSAGAKTVIEQWDENQISVEASVPANQKINVSAYYTGDDTDLVITVTPPNVSFIDGITEFGVINWLEDIFSYSGDVVVTIKFPKTIYDSLTIQQGSGSLSISELYARQNNITIGSGSFEYDKDVLFEADSFNVDLGSGSAVIKNMRTKSYVIDLGSGRLECTGLSGTGVLDMGSGKCSLYYADFNGDTNVDMGSGALSLYLPSNANLSLKTDIGSGAVTVKALGVDKRLTIADNDDVVLLGNGEGPTLSIDMGSGSIQILDSTLKPQVGYTDTIPGVVDITNSSSFSSSSFGTVHEISQVAEDPN